MVTLTEDAAAQVKKIQTESGADGKFLRIAATAGGCSGNQYQLGFDDASEGDSKFESAGITVLVDENSLALINGAEIDYIQSLEGSSFVFKNPNATGGCGCGKSFSC